MQNKSRTLELHSQNNGSLKMAFFQYKGLGAIRAKIGPTSDVDKISSKMYSQYVLFGNKYSYLICVSNSSQRIDKFR